MDDGGFSRREGRDDRTPAPLVVRFWAFVNGDWVKLTLGDGEELTWFTWCRTDEGYHAEEQTWCYSEGLVVRETRHDGRDCDGRHSGQSAACCPWWALASVPATRNTRGGWVGGLWVESRLPVPDEKGEPIRRPDWQESQPRSVRDYTAEACGY